MAYVLCKNKCNYIIDNFEFSTYEYQVKKNKKINLIFFSWIDHDIYLKFGINLQKLLARIIDYVEDDSTEEGSLLLDELARLRAILKNKYENFLSQEQHEIYMQKIRISANELKKKIYFELNKNIVNNKSKIH